MLRLVNRMSSGGWRLNRAFKISGYITHPFVNSDLIFGVLKGKNVVIIFLGEKPS